MDCHRGPRPGRRAQFYNGGQRGHRRHGNGVDHRCLYGRDVGGRGPGRVSDTATGHAGRRDPAVQHRAMQRNARTRHRTRRRGLPGTGRSVAIHVLLSRPDRGHGRTGRHARQRPAGAAGDGRGGTGPDLPLSDGDHGGQRDTGRDAVALCAHRNRRERRDGTYRPRRRRMVDLCLQRLCTRRGRVRGVCTVRRFAALQGTGTRGRGQHRSGAHGNASLDHAGRNRRVHRGRCRVRALMSA